MSTSTTTASSKPARKVTPRKPAASKTAAKKPAAKKVEVESTLEKYFSKEQFKEVQGKVQKSVDKVSDLAKDVVYAQLGLVGKLYDTVNERLEDLSEQVEARRSQAPKQWESLIKRGNAVQKDLEKAQSELKGRVSSFDLKGKVQANVEKAQEAVEVAVDKVKGVLKAA